jgi:hypothetical protein
VLKRCTALLVAVSLLAASLDSWGVISSVDTFAIVWAAFLLVLLWYGAFYSVGTAVRNFFELCETEDEKMGFFLQIRYWTRSVVLFIINLAYLPILAKVGPLVGRSSACRLVMRVCVLRQMFKLIYKAKKKKKKLGLHVHAGPWALAVALAAVYGVGFPILMWHLMRRRKRKYQWLADPEHPGEGRYEPKSEALAESNRRADYSFLELEQQVRAFASMHVCALRAFASIYVCALSSCPPFFKRHVMVHGQVYHLEQYARRMPVIRSMERRDDLIQRVRGSLAGKRKAARESRRRAEEAFNFRQGHPVDDFWRPLRPSMYWWKLAVRGRLCHFVVMCERGAWHEHRQPCSMQQVYYGERGFLVALVISQDGQKVRGVPPRPLALRSKQAVLKQMDSCTGGQEHGHDHRVLPRHRAVAGGHPAL